MVAISENPVFQDADKAREFLESQLWPNGPVCPHCGVVGCATQLRGKAHRAGVYKCNDCDKQFTVTVGTLFERSHIPLNKWLLILHLMVASKKGISAHQIHRMLGLTYKSAWFACHRLREAMREGKLPDALGGEGKFVEADETYVGGKAKNRAYAKTLPAHEAVMSLVERGGKVRSRHVADVTAKTLKPIIAEAIAKDSHFRTDQAPVYTEIGTGFASHETVNHSIKEYVRGDAHTNTVEGYFSIFKRGIYGVYHHVSEQHLKRYLCEFDFRYNERIALGVGDDERMTKALSGIVGKRLTYRRTRGAEADEAAPF